MMRRFNSNSNIACKMLLIPLTILLSFFASDIDAAGVDQSLLDIPEIHMLDETVSQNRLLTHDLLKCLQFGGFHNTTDAITTFFSHHYVYSVRFIDYLTKVVSKVDDPEIAEPILENISEENGNYEEADLENLECIGINREWYNEIPHKDLSKRFLHSLNIDTSYLKNLNDMDHAGYQFTSYMLDMYDKTNPCEALAVIGFAIEETVSKLYQFIYDGLVNHTSLLPRDYVFFPLHIFLDDGHADLLKLGFKHYLTNDPTMCKNAAGFVNEVLEKRALMFDKVKQEIEETQGYVCNIDNSDNNNKKNINENVILMNVDATVNSQIITKETVVNAVNKAQKESIAQVTEIENMYNYTLFQKMALSSRILSNMQKHGDTLSGQISCIDEIESDNNKLFIWTTPYGKPLNVITKHDFLLIDQDLNVLASSSSDGKNHVTKVNKATRFHIHVYKKRKDIKCIIHTHPPHTSALSITGVPLLPLHMDTMALYDDVQFLQQWPGIPFGSEEGNTISKVLGNSNAALLANHGFIVAGNSIEQVTYRAYFFEKAAEMQLEAMSAVGGDISKLAKVDHDIAIRARNWRISKGPVNSHFYGWVQVLLNDNILHKNAI